jgi:hypothetical protein
MEKGNRNLLFGENLKSIMAIPRISGGRAANPGYAAGGKFQEILDGREGARVVEQLAACFSRIGSLRMWKIWHARFGEIKQGLMWH